MNKNQERIAALEKDVANLKGRIEDGMHIAIHGKDRVNKRPKKEDEYNGEDDDVDDFYDRTASSSKRQRKENTAESEGSLIEKWKSLLEEHVKQQRLVTRTLESCTALQSQIDNSKEDDEDAFFLQNDLTLANENLSKAKSSLEELEKELDEVEYLLKIVNPKLVWDRNEGLIGTSIEKMKEGVLEGPAVIDSVTQKTDGVDAMESDSCMMPPPPPPVVAAAAAATSVALAMPPPPPMAVASLSKPTSPQQRRVLGPSKPPTSHDNGKSGHEVSMMPPPPPTQSLENTTAAGPPQKKQKQMGPRRPPVNVQGTLAALMSRPTTSAPDSRSNNGNAANDATLQKKTPVVSDPFELQKDEWNAPVGQDGSGRTALHEKFKGRY